MKKGLVIKSPFIEDILKGIKTLEIRGSSTKFRGEIVLLKSGSGLALGTIEITDSAIFSLEDYNKWDYRIYRKKEKTNVLPYKKTYAWKLENPKFFDKPKPYKHPLGAITWVNLPEDF